MLRYDICTRPNAPTRCGPAVDHLESCNHPPIIYRLCHYRLDRCAVRTLVLETRPSICTPAWSNTSKHGLSPRIRYFHHVTASPLLLEAFHNLLRRFRVCTCASWVVRRGKCRHAPNINTLLVYTASNTSLQHTLGEVLHRLPYTQVAENLLGTSKNSIKLICAVELLNHPAHTTLRNSATSEDVDGFICDFVCRAGGE